MKNLSIIIPCYNEQESLHLFYLETCHVIDSIDNITVEFLFIDDGSRDHTLDIVKKLAKLDTRIKYISFSRNFGKEAAIYAGLSHAQGDYVVVMDADLQDPPSLLPDMLKAVCEEGFDCAGTRRVSRHGEPPIRSFFARMFYRFINVISKTKLVDGARDYKLLNRKAVDALLSMPECNRFSKGLYEWIGFKTKWFEYENIERVAGETKWSFWKLFIYSLEGIVAFSTVPLAIASGMGIILLMISIIAIIILSIRQILFHNSVDGWTSLICSMVFLSGVQLFCLGIMGQYLSKMYLETKRRPIFIACETLLDRSE